MGSQVSAEQINKDFAEYGRKPEYFNDELPAHEVEIRHGFLMSATEVTVGQFREFVSTTGYKTAAETDGEGGWGYDKDKERCLGRDIRFNWQTPGYTQTDNHPVVNVSWDDCQAYCKWRTQVEGRLVRLPTEAEWEYACRAGTNSYYNMGNAKDDLLSKARTLRPSEEIIKNAVQNLKIAEENAINFPEPVASYKPNAFGLFDMHGNVWEWTADWYGEDYYARSPSVDPKGPVQGNVRVRRGGAWNSFPLWARSSFRNWNQQDSRCLNLGFRLVAETTATEREVEDRQKPLRLLFVGDIMLDGGPGHAVANGIDPFAGCAGLLHDADVTIGNLECVLGGAGRQLDKPYTFRGASDSAKYLKKYFQALSLANNHSGDYGPEGIAECMKILADNDIGYFGAGLDIADARVGLQIDLRGRRILLLGYNEFRAKEYQATESKPGSAPLNEEWILEDIQRVKKQQQADIVIPFVHWGDEMVSMPMEYQRQMARRWIDAGATAVIGSHPHVTQTIETYHGAPIVYSLGNFVFDYFPVDPPQWTGWAVRLTIPPQGPIDLETIAVELDLVGLPKPVATE